MKKFTFSLAFALPITVLAIGIIVALAQSNPGFIDGAHLCANYPNDTCSNDPQPNPLSLNQAFMNKMDVGGTAPTPPSTVSTLPLCNTSLMGTRLYVTDGQTNPAWLSIVLTAPTGSTVSPVFCNGTNWVYG
jgi:hypothetical protein